MANKTVKLPTAYYPPDDRTIHISERLPQKAQLICPFCRGEVLAKKGSERQHHFAHVSGASKDCSPSKDVLLHEGAKVFLFNALMERKSVDIIVQDLEKLPSDFSGLFKFLGITGFTIPTSSLQSFACPYFRMEEKITEIRPDITSFDNRQYAVFAWEIFVTHAVEEAKRRHLGKLGYGYIELKPAPLEPSGYAFFLESFGGFELLKNKDLLDFLFDQKKSELLESYGWKLDQEYRIKIFQEEKAKAEKRHSEDLRIQLAKEMLSTDVIRQNNIRDELRRDLNFKFATRIDKVNTEKIIEQILADKNIYAAFKKKTCLTILPEKTSISKKHFAQKIELVEFINFNSLRFNKRFEFNITIA